MVRILAASPFAVGRRDTVVGRTPPTWHSPCRTPCGAHHRSRSARAAWHGRTEVTTSCMYASFTPCLTSAVSRAPEARVALCLLPAIRLGARRGAPDSLRGRQTDQHHFCLSATTDCTDPFDDRGTPKSSLPTNVLGTQLTCDLVAVRRGPTGRPSPRTAVRARAILEDLNEGDRR